MFCRFCGAENPDEAAFCKQCGKRLTSTAPVEKNSITFSDMPSGAPTTSADSGISCPFCHASSDNCHPVVKTDIKTSGGGYGFWNGCCGFILLGPVGLLCGACGSSVKTKVRNETWWVCQKCGKEFISKQSAVERANISLRTATLYSLFLAAGVGYSLGESGGFWIAAIAALIVVGLWASIPMSMQESSGLSMDELLTPTEKTSFWIKYISLCTVSVLGGLLWGLSAIG